MDTEAKNNEAVIAELQETLRIAGNALALMHSELTIKGELVKVTYEVMGWLGNMKKLLVERINELGPGDKPEDKCDNAHNVV